MITVAPSPGLRSVDGRPFVGVAVLGSAVSGAISLGLLRQMPVDLPIVALLLAGFVICGGLATFDLFNRRVPNGIVVPSFAACALVLTVVGVATDDGAVLFRGCVGALIVGGPWLLLYLATSGRLVGGGDVKLALLIGLLVGPLDAVVAQVALAASLLGWVAVGIAVRVRQRDTRFPFAPVLVVAGLMGLAGGALLSSDGVRLAIGGR